MFRPAVNQLAFSTLGVERLRINDNGYIGINTIAPSTILEVQGTASASYGQFANTIQVGAGGIASVSYNRFGSSTTSQAHYITGSSDLFISSDLEVDGSVSFNGPASISNTLYLSTLGKTGNVGIGTTGPSDKLQVQGTDGNGITITRSSINDDQRGV